ncbi:hypothetical protein THAOC_02055, partial [Thalassiosira oceanica]
CGRGNSKIMETDMLPGKSPLGSYDVVKAAFERCYEKLGVSCQDVGGLVIKKQDDASLIGSKCDLRYTSETSEQAALVPTSPLDAVVSGFKPTLRPTNNATSNRHKCACEAEEMNFMIDCDDRQAMTDALDFINTNGCTEKGSCEAGTECEKNYLIVQSHYGLCPEENIPEAIEEGIHDFDESCLGCDILRAYTVGAPDCPAAVCADTSGEDAYVSLIEKNCASDCLTDECKGLFLTLRVVHESCPNGVLTDAAERGLQDLEGLCKDVVCNAGGKDDDPFTCTEVDKAGYDDRDDYRVTFSPAPSPSTYEPTLTAFPTTDPPVEKPYPTEDET